MQPATPSVVDAGSAITLSGSNFAGGICAAALCGEYESSCSILSPNTVQIITSSLVPVGSCDVAVRFLNPPSSLYSLVSARNAVRISGGPTPSSQPSLVVVTPASAYRSSVVTITGFVFLKGSSTNDCSVYICGVLSTCSIVSSTTIVSTVSSSPSVAFGQCPVVVQFNSLANADQGFAVGQLTIFDAPVLAEDVSPIQAWAGSTATVHGRNFAGGSCSASVCGQAAVSCEITQPTQIFVRIGELLLQADCALQVSFLNPFAAVSARLFVRVATLLPGTVYSGSTVSVTGIPVFPKAAKVSCIVHIANVSFGNCRAVTRPTSLVTFALEGFYNDGSFVVRVDFQGDVRSSLLLGPLHILPPPKLLNLDPFQVYKNAVITITGKDFLTASQSCKAHVCGITSPSCDILNSTTAIAILSPSISVGTCTVELQFSNPVSARTSSSLALLEVLGIPDIFSTVPAAPFSGGTVTVRGTNFIQPCDVVVLVNSTLNSTLAATLATPSSLVAVMPDFHDFYSPFHAQISVACCAGSQQSEFVPFHICMNPSIDSIYPDTVYTSSSVTVAGSCFNQPCRVVASHDDFSFAVFAGSIRVDQLEFSVPESVREMLSDRCSIFNVSVQCLKLVDPVTRISVYSASAQSIVSVCPKPIITSIDPKSTFPSFAGISNMLTLSGSNFMMRVCTARLCNTEATQCTPLNKTHAIATISPLQYSFNQTRCPIEFSFWGMGLNAASVSQVYVTIMPKPIFTNFLSAAELSVYSGSRITITGRLFFPQEELCTAKICGLDALQCAVEFPANSSTLPSYRPSQTWRFC
jgi:hypothetical protein